MLAIRFARVGKTKQPTYRITVSDKRRDTFGRALEILGHYNPRTNVCEVKADRIKYWISVGAQPSATVHNLLVDQNVIAGPKVKVSRGKKKKSGEAAAVPAAGAAPEGGAAEKKEPAAEQPQPTPAAETAPSTTPSTPSSSP